MSRWRWIGIGVLVLAGLLAAGCGGAGESNPPSEQAAKPDSPARAPAGVAEPAAPAGSSTIAGTVRYEGAVPKLGPVRMDADPGCAKKHASPPESEALVLGDGNTVGNIFVHVTGGLSAGSHAAPAEPAVIDQNGCRYSPHVLGVMVGQPIKILNSDGLLHNVHALPKKNKTFNMAMPASRTEAETRFDVAEQMFKIKCDVHPWMSAWVAVLPHPYFDVTAEDGKFEITGLPAGSYKIEAWHEKLGTRSMSADVADGETAAVDFTFKK